MKTTGGTTRNGHLPSVERQGQAGAGLPGASIRPGNGPHASRPVTRTVPARVVIRPARPDDLEEATLLERRVWGPMAATLNELQRRLFALPEAFLLAEMYRPGRPPQIVGLTNGLLWTREFPRSYTAYEKMLPSGSHNPRGEVLYVTSLGVDETIRGRGVGLRLLLELVEVGRRRHLKLVRLIGNQRSRPLYERAGFATIQALPRMYRQHRALMPHPVLMEFPLV
jgi:ribosomal protein S18 acetylase RimI-like enzyme